MIQFAAIFGVSLVVSYITTAVIRPAAHRIGAVDHPNERKIHAEPIPRLGGVAIWLGVMVSLAFFIIFQRFVPDDVINLELDPELWGFLIGGAIIMVVGIIDDIFGLTPLVKLTGQVLAAATLIASGVRMEFIGNPFGPDGSLFYLGNVGIVMTLFWVVAFTNIVNFIDGLDGLAAGISAIAGFTFFAFSWQTGQIGIALISLALTGSALGFLRHNFYPAKIFMGDSGSMFLGFAFGALTVEGVMKSIAAVALFAPLVIMAIPILDASLAILRRYRNNQPVTQADRDHLHHRLLRRGLSHRQTVLLIYAWSAALSALGLTFKVLPSFQKYLIIFVGLFLTFLFAEVVGFFDVGDEQTQG